MRYYMTTKITNLHFFTLIQAQKLDHWPVAGRLDDKANKYELVEE